MSQIPNVTADDFVSVIELATTPVLVDFWAPWCGPCKMIAPILDELVEAYEGKLQIVKVNADENKELATKLGIRGIPALVIYKDGVEANRKIGAANKLSLAAFIDQNI